MTHHENCDVNDINPDGIVKPCNCGAPLKAEMQALAESSYPMCDEARTLLQLAVRAQSGEAIDIVAELEKVRRERDALRAVAQRYLNVPELRNQ